LTRYLDENSVSIFGVTGIGRHLMVVAVEYEPGHEWDIVAAREMNADEAKVFDHLIDTKPDGCPP
jgi:hypothetical protein